MLIDTVTSAVLGMRVLRRVERQDEIWLSQLLRPVPRLERLLLSGTKAMNPANGHGEA